MQRMNFRLIFLIIKITIQSKVLLNTYKYILDYYICSLLKTILTKTADERISLNELLFHPFFGGDN